MVVLFDAVKFESVDEAVERKPFWKDMVVDVACSPEERVVNGYAKVPLQPVQEPTVRLPILAELALRTEVLATLVFTTPLVLISIAKAEEVAKEVAEEVAR